MSNVIHILVVDDDPVACALLKEALMAEDYTVATASNGFEAMERLRGETFQLLITDFIMPVLDGLSLLTQTKGLFPDLPVILMTASCDEVILNKAKREGADVVIPKPFGQIKLLEIINEVLQKLREEKP